jgi:hypothetical protein
MSRKSGYRFSDQDMRKMTRSETMRKPMKKYAVKETPKQRKARVRRVRYDARRLAMCNILEFWQACRIAACRRNQSCRGDAHACFMQRWRSVPEGLMDFARECLDEQEQSRCRMRGL